MTLEELRRQAGSWLRDLADQVCPGAAGETLAERIERRKQEIRQGYDELLRHRRFLESLQAGITANEQRAAALPWEVSNYLQTGNRAAAWRAAMLLDELRYALEQDRIRQCDSQAAYERRAEELAEQRRWLGRMQMALRRQESQQDGSCAYAPQ
ncbi:MAG: hypothetical protein JNM56_36160 [Planctomycetia bacterium]|nr:hypothetical protein [Planctomycetia bacterium]